MSEASVESEQAVGDALEVVDLLDVRARFRADPPPLRRRGDERLERRAQRLLRRAHDGHAGAELSLRSLDGLVVQEWTATATHANEMRRGDLVAEPTGKKISWDGLDVIPFENGLVKRKDVYSDSVSILKQLALI